MKAMIPVSARGLTELEQRGGGNGEEYNYSYYQ